MPDIDPDLAADMYGFAAGSLEQAGYAQYEISNWAKPGLDGLPLICRHNLQYWQNLPYAGLGAGAHGFLYGQRTANVLAPAAYIQRMKIGDAGPFPRTPATASAETVDASREMAETMMMGLRLVETGVSREEFGRRFGRQLDEVYGQEITRLSELGLLESVNGQRNAVRLTERGRLLGNQVFMEFVEG
jgi:oxygen-independent coproporphyrinogen-3 oxidase